MNARTIRRAAERKAAKLAKKQAPVSDAMQAANAANAQLSTGPVTPEGKAISSRNHTTHGLTVQLSSETPATGFKVLPWENQAAYDALLASYRREWNPQTATEHNLVHRMCTHGWLCDRAMVLQNEIVAQVGEVMAVNDRKDFALYMRYQSTHARAQSKAFSEMLRLRNFLTGQRRAEAIQQKRVVDAQNRFESQKQKAELHAARMESIRLKQEAIKQRNQAAVKPAITSETTTETSAAAIPGGL